MHRHVPATTALLLTALTLHSLYVAAAELSDDSSLAAVIREAERRHRAFTDQVVDYTCTLVKREQINGQLLGY